LSRAALRADPDLQGMLVLQPGSRLSITPVTPQEWGRLQELLAEPAA
jgi:predicted RNA-binding protein with PUA-like domain